RKADADLRPPDRELETRIGPLQSLGGIGLSTLRQVPKDEDHAAVDPVIVDDRRAAGVDGYLPAVARDKDRVIDHADQRAKAACPGLRLLDRSGRLLAQGAKDFRERASQRV